MLHLLVLLHISMDYSTQMRVAVRVRVTDLPGEPLSHPWTLGNIICNEFLHHPLNSWPDPLSYDDMIILEEFNLDKPIERWFIYNLNIKCALNWEELLIIIFYKVFLVSQETSTW